MDKLAELAGPGVGSYTEVAAALPTDYRPLLSRRQTQEAIFAVREYVERELCRELGLLRVTVPLVVPAGSGLNDMLDRDGSRTPVGFHVSNDGDRNPVDAEVVQAATKWKRLALREFDCRPGEGICTDMRAVRKDYFLDHDHSCYVDQWDWEQVIRPEQRSVAYLHEVVRRIWRVLVGAQHQAREQFPALADPRYPDLPEELSFVHAEDLLAAYPQLPRKARETALLREHPAVFLTGIGWPLADGYPHELRAADYDDWITDTSAETGRPTHGLNGDLLVWNPVTRRRHELSSMGIRVSPQTLVQQLRMSGQLDRVGLSYHQAVLRGDAPASVGGGIGQSRTLMLLLRTAHLGEVSVSVWPPVLTQMCRQRNIDVLT